MLATLRKCPFLVENGLMYVGTSFCIFDLNQGIMKAPHVQILSALESLTGCERLEKLGLHNPEANSSIRPKRISR